MRFTPIQTNFSAGELSPLTRGRVDVAKFKNGCQLLSNFTLVPQGGATRRPGTEYINTVKNSNFARLLPFVFSENQAYILEFGELYIRFYRNGINILNGGTPVEVVTPYHSTDVDGLAWCQSADTLYLVHPNYPPQTLTRTSDIAWTLTPILFLDGPYLDTNTNPNEYLTVSANTGSITITSHGFTPFLATDVGRLIRFESEGFADYATITSYSSSSSVGALVGTIYDVPTGDSPVSNLPDFTGPGYIGWRLGAFSGTTGYPVTVCFFEQRLVFGGTPSNPQTYWMSKTNDFYGFGPTDGRLNVNDDNSIVYTLNSQQVNQIKWLRSSASLIMGTSGAEFVIQEANTTEPVSPTNIQSLLQSTNGSAPMNAIQVGSSIIFVQRSARKVKELIYQFAISAYDARDISIWSEHLLWNGGGLIDIAYQQEPYTTIWFVRADGVLIGLTYLREEKVEGWHQHTIGGVSATGNAIVESICCVPKSDGSTDQLYMIVQRLINGATVRYIEVLQDYYRPTSPTDTSNMWFVDSGLMYSGAPATSFTATHLPNTTVEVIADGGCIGQFTTDGNGTFKTKQPYTSVLAGIGFTSTLQTLPPSFEFYTTTNQGKIARVAKVVLRLKDALNFKWGHQFDANGNLPYEIDFRQATDLMDMSAPLFSGDQLIDLDNNPEYDQSFYILQDQPLPLTVLAMVPHEWSYDE